MGACADHAAALGQDVLVEPINRYETPVLSTVDDTLAFLAEMRPHATSSCCSTPST